MAGAGLFLALGVAAYLLPPLTLVFAFGFLINKLDGLRKRWPWAIAMILAGSAGLSLYPNLFGGWLASSTPWMAAATSACCLTKLSFST